MAAQRERDREAAKSRRQTTLATYRVTSIEARKADVLKPSGIFADIGYAVRAAAMVLLALISTGVTQLFGQDRGGKLVAALAEKEKPAEALLAPMKNYESFTYKNGLLDIIELQVGEQRYNLVLDLNADAHALGFAPVEAPKQILGTRTADGHLAVYMVFDSEIRDYTTNEKGKNTAGIASPRDSSAIFTDRASMHLTEDGILVATTATTLIILEGSEGKFYPYAAQLNGIEPLKSPRIEKGTKPNTVVLRDPTMPNQKLVINLANGDMTPEDDLQAVGTR